VSKDQKLYGAVLRLRGMIMDPQDTTLTIRILFKLNKHRKL